MAIAPPGPKSLILPSNKSKSKSIFKYKFNRFLEESINMAPPYWLAAV